MTDFTPVVDRYIATWNETDGGRRRKLIAETWAEDGSYLDPLLRGDGVDSIDALVAGVQQQFPGHRMERSGEVDAHNDRVRFAWAMVDESGASPGVTGVDFGVVAADGRLRAITGFFDEMPVMPDEA